MHDGQKVGPFQIDRELGSGAMGQVYLARYIKNGQKVAIKVIAAGLRNSTAQARFQREAEVLEQLEHPNIVRFYVVSEFEGRPITRWNSSKASRSIDCSNVAANCPGTTSSKSASRSVRRSNTPTKKGSSIAI